MKGESRQFFDRVQCELLTEIIREYGGNLSAVARRLKYNRTHVHKLIRKYGLTELVIEARYRAAKNAKLE